MQAKHVADCRVGLCQSAVSDSFEGNSSFAVFLLSRHTLSGERAEGMKPAEPHQTDFGEAYITPYKRFKMKLQPNLNCHICKTASSGTFLHMFWECPIVISLWTHVNLVLSSLLRIDWSVNPSLCLLNDDSGLCISSIQKRMLFAGFTAVKKTIIQNWFTPNMCWKHIGSIASCK